jgi:ferritin
MIGEKISKAFNEQVKHEAFSAYLYLQMAAYLHGEGLDGCGHWMRVQAMEEMTHAMKFFDHIIERGGTVELLEIEKPQAEWDSPLEAFRAALKHEQFITGKINDLVTLAAGENDYASRSMLQWFVDEQVEEEANAEKNVSNFEIAGDSGQGILMIDREMGTRPMPYTPAAGGV